MSESRSEKWQRLARSSDWLVLAMEANREIESALRAARVYPADVNRPNVDNEALARAWDEGFSAPRHQARNPYYDRDPLTGGRITRRDA